jgi:O-antigen/teichoic acid export membrane protein
VKLLFVFLQMDLVWFAAVISLDYVILACGLYAVYRQQGGRVLTWEVQAAMIKRLLMLSVPFAIADFCFLGLMNSDQIMIKIMRGETEVGWYAAAAMISSLWYFVPLALGSTFMPYIIRNSDAQIKNSNIRLLFSAMTFFTIVGTAVVFILAPMIVKLVLGREFELSAPILTVLIFNGIFIFHVHIRSRVLIALDKLWCSTLLFLGALILNLLGNFILIPMYGAIGAAWSSVAAWGASVLILPMLLSDTRRFISIFLSPRLSGMRGLIDALKG